MKKIILLVLLFVAGHTFAGNQSGNVEKLRVSGRDYAPPFQNPTHVKLSGEYDTKPVCATSGYWAVNTETVQGKAMLTLLHTSYVTGKEVIIWGTGNCSLWPDMETVYQVGFGKE